MSAAMMDGNTQKMTGVINIEETKNPIQVAAKIRAMGVVDRLLGGHGATKWAREHGFEKFSTETPLRRAEYEAKVKSTRTGTVGCVALDQEGKLAVGTSTGGKGWEIPGRVSDSATVAGNYCNELCGCLATGVGEDIVSNATAAKIVARVTDGMTLEMAFEKTFNEMKHYKGLAGAVAIDSKGNIFHD